MPGGDAEHAVYPSDWSSRSFQSQSQDSRQPSYNFSDAELNDTLTFPSDSSLTAVPCPSHFDQPGPHLALSAVPKSDDYYQPRQSPLAEDSISLGNSAAVDLADAANVCPMTVDSALPRPANTLASLPYHSTTYTSTQAPSESSTGVDSPLPSAPNPRQISFKDLVNKFNNSSDHILPMPSASGAREISRPGSPVNHSNTITRSRASSRLQTACDSPSERQPAGRGFQNTENTVYPPSQRLGSRDADFSDYSTLLDPLYQSISGERLPPNESIHNENASYGAPLHSRRRGSEGSILSRKPPVLSGGGLLSDPLIPTSRHPSQSPSLEVTSVGSGLNSHRRRKSDFSDIRPRHIFIDRNLLMTTAVSQCSVFLGSSRPRSLIPIPSQCGDANSVSRVPSQSVEHESTFILRSPSPVQIPSKDPNYPPRLSFRSYKSSLEYTRKQTSLASYGGLEMNSDRADHQASQKSASLQDFVPAAHPKKSPPLRSSRPRQTLTNGTSHDSSKVLSRASNSQKRVNNVRNSKSQRLWDQRPSELSNVDFAIRREKIQQAFSRTVQEREKEEEKAAEVQRRKHAQEKYDIQAANGFTRSASIISLSVSAENTATVIDKSTEIRSQAKGPVFLDDGETIGDAPQLHIDTSAFTRNPVAKADSSSATIDSPTLGLLATAAKEHESEEIGPRPTSKPASPKSPDTVETYITTFDNEPQADLIQNDEVLPHQTLLSQIMQIREFGSSSSSSDEMDYGSPGANDRELIRVTQRDDSCSCGYQSNGDTQEDHEYPTGPSQVSSEIQNRWSLSSWSSSLNNKLEKDLQSERRTPDISGHLASAEDNDPRTQPCPVDSNTPPSTGHGYMESTFDREQSMDQRVGETLLQNMRAHSNAPSLARQGGWDSQRVAQLYMETLARSEGYRFPMMTISRASDPNPLEGSQSADRNSDRLTGSFAITRKLDISPLEQISNAASLMLRDDWEHASPSVADWMKAATDGNFSLPGGANVNSGAPVSQENTNVANICLDRTLSSASVTGEIQEGTPPPPLPRRSPPPPPLLAGDENEDVSQPLPSQQRSTMLNTELHLQRHASSAGNSEGLPGERFEPMLSYRALHSVVSLAPPHLMQTGVGVERKPSFSDQRRLKKRRHVIKELIDTEYSFGRDMKVVDDIYKGTSSSCLDLSPDDVKVLFANSDQIVQFSIEFQDALKNAARSVYVMPRSQRWTSKRGIRSSNTNAKEDNLPTGDEFEKDRMTSIGRVFIAYMPQMEKVYTDYLRNHDAANRKLQILQRNPKVAIWLKECRDWAADLTSAWDLDSLLVKPVQRILKYPLLLDQLLSSTISDHPDYASIAQSIEQVTNISVRINEMKKRADVVGQVVGRMRKESDVRSGLSKAFGRRTEKLKQQTGLVDMIGDKEYDALAQRFGDSYFQLQVAMRDVEMYVQAIQTSMDRLSEFAMAIERQVDVAASNYSELEGKWRQLRTTIGEIVSISLPDHLVIVQRSVINPMVTLLGYYEGPQRVMRKRDKRLLDYTRFKTAKERGDKPDKKTSGQGEQFVALNETLKDELPKLYRLTAKLMEACLKNFVQIQTTWLHSLEQRFRELVDSCPSEIQKIVSDWTEESAMATAQVQSLGICNGALLADTVNVANYSSAHHSSPPRPSTFNSASTRIGSSMDSSPKVSQDFGSSRHSMQSSGEQAQVSSGRQRADSVASGRIARESHGDVPRSQSLQQVSDTSSYTYVRKSFPVLPQLSLDAPFLVEIAGQPSTESTITPPSGRYSGFFSSAMPMSDSPGDTSFVDSNDTPKEPKALFLVASIYEFNIDRARREAGYPYLTYVAGEIFDVIGEKGELWLARNQDDPTHQVGWIWNKHFAKLSE